MVRKFTNDPEQVNQISMALCGEAIEHDSAEDVPTASPRIRAVGWVLILGAKKQALGELEKLRPRRTLIENEGVCQPLDQVEIANIDWMYLLMDQYKQWLQGIEELEHQRQAAAAYWGRFLGYVSFEIPYGLILPHHKATKSSVDILSLGAMLQKQKEPQDFLRAREWKLLVAQLAKLGVQPTAPCDANTCGPYYVMHHNTYPIIDH